MVKVDVAYNEKNIFTIIRVLSDFKQHFIADIYS